MQLITEASQDPAGFNGLITALGAFNLRAEVLLCVSSSIDRNEQGLLNTSHSAQCTSALEQLAHHHQNRQHVCQVTPSPRDLTRVVSIQYSELEIMHLRLEILMKGIGNNAIFSMQSKNSAGPQ